MWTLHTVLDHGAAVLCAQVGGGPTGVEIAAEIHDLVLEDISHYFPSLKVAHTHSLHGPLQGPDIAALVPVSMHALSKCWNAALSLLLRISIAALAFDHAAD